MTGPLNGDAVCGQEAQVHPQGYFLESGWRITVAAAPTPNGPWTDVASTMASTSPMTWTDKDGSTENYYAWDVGNISIPPGSWAVENGVRATYIKGYSPKQSPSGNDIVMNTFDNPNVSPTHQDWFTCAYNKWNAAANMKFYNAVLACRSAQSPAVRITAPMDSTCPCASTTTVGGDVTIAAPTDVSPLRCVSEITGALTIKNGPALDRVSLPQLLKIDGDLNADLTPPSGSSLARVLNIPALAGIGNNVTVTATTPPGATTSVDLGLPAMASIGGSMQLSFSGGPAKVTGLGPVPTLNKDVSIAFGADTDASGLLTSLNEVKGNASVSVGGKLTGLFPALAKVDGTLSLTHTSTATQSATLGLTNLASVGKDLDLQALPWASFGTAAFGKLGSVGGTLRVEQSQLTTFDIGLATLSMGNLQIGDNAVLASLPIRSLKVSTAGDVTVVNDPQLPTCQVSNFLDAQTALGWTGTFSVSGTNDNATCP